MNQIKVAIVGAGPVGMCAALGLARAGIECTLFEARTESQTIGSRAIVLDRGSLQHMNDIGCLGDILDRGLVALRRRTFYRGTELFSHEFRQDGPLPLFVNIPQSETEQVLLDHVENSCQVSMLRGHRVTGLRQSSREVVLTVTTEDGDAEFACEHVLACDGCRSPVRKLCGLDFPGETNPYRFLIVDIAASLPQAKEHHFHFDHPAHRGLTLLMVPQPNDVWRIDWQLPLGSPADGYESTLPDRIRSVIGDTRFEVVWSSCYQFHQRLMTSMSHGRVHFLGDAAHLVNPFGARGMNSGIQDARSIAGKLIEVIHGEADESLLQTYALERGRAHLIHQYITRQTMSFIAPATWGDRLVRNLILRGSRRFKKLRSLVNSGSMSTVSPYTHVMDFPVRPLVSVQ